MTWSAIQSARLAGGGFIACADLLDEQGHPMPRPDVVRNGFHSVCARAQTEVEAIERCRNYMRAYRV